jgi:hypothetical protein
MGYFLRVRFTFFGSGVSSNLGKGFEYPSGSTSKSDSFSNPRFKRLIA